MRRASSTSKLSLAGRKPIPLSLENEDDSAAPTEPNVFAGSPAHITSPLPMPKNTGERLSRSISAPGGLALNLSVQGSSGLQGSSTPSKAARSSSSPLSPLSPTSPKGTPKRMSKGSPKTVGFVVPPLSPEAVKRTSLSLEGNLPSPKHTTKARAPNFRSLTLLVAEQKLSPHAAAMLRRRVTFCPTPTNTSHAVTPYASIYGKHPQLFDFNRKGEMQLNNAGVADELRRSRDFYDMPSPD